MEGQDTEAVWAILDQQALLPLGQATSSPNLGQTARAEPSARNAVRQQHQMGMLAAACSRLQQASDDSACDMYDDDEVQSQMENTMLDPNDFQAGNLRNHFPAWQQLFICFGHTSHSKQVLSWIEHGIQLDFVAVHAKSQLQHPRFGARLQLVEKLLAKTVGKNNVANMLLGNKPSPVQFANRVSCMQHPDIVRDTIQKLTQTGAMIPWTGEAPPVVISGLGVVANRKGKLRLILECRYLNLFLRYGKLKYERLADVPKYLKQGHWFVLTDLKSGYHHIPLHENSWTYFGIEFEGQVLVYTHVPFGEASAPGDLQPSWDSSVNLCVK